MFSTSFTLTLDAADRTELLPTRFLANAAHDLREPLMAMSCLNRALRRRTLDPEMVHLLVQQEKIVKSAWRLLEALLMLGRLDSHTAKPQLVDFATAPLLQALELEFAAIAASKGIELEIAATDHYVHSDPLLVEQMLRNLLSNAIKYTHCGKVAFKCACLDTSRVSIEILDTGVGISPEQLPRIFEEFHRGGASRSSHEGCGLGLSIVQRIVRLLGLQLTVRSEVGKGSAFSFSLPAANPAREDDGQPSEYPWSASLDLYLLGEHAEL